MSDWEMLAGEVFLQALLESVAAMDQPAGKGKQRGGYFLKTLECVNPSFSPQHYFLLNVDFLLLGLKKTFALNHSVL